MKLVNAKLHEEEIKRKMWEVWYDEKYQYYFGGNWRSDFSLSNNNDYMKYAFAVLNDKDVLIGYIGYSIDTDLRIAQWFGAINFSDDKISFGLALYQVIKDCFIKFGMNVVTWHVICGNPIEESYDKICEKLGGHIVGINHKSARDMSGNICDSKSYEILREDFLRTKCEKEQKMQASKILLSNVQVTEARRLLEVWEFYSGEIGVAYENCNVKDGEWLHTVFGKGHTFEEACEDYLSKIRGETLVFDYNKPNRFEVEFL